MTVLELTADELRQIVDTLDNPEIDVALAHHPAYTTKEVIRKILRGRVMITLPFNRRNRLFLKEQL